MPLKIFKIFLSKIHYLSVKLVNGIKRFVTSLIEPAFYLIKRVLRIIYQIRLSIYLFQGKDKWDGNNLNILFFGRKWALPYFSDLLYSNKLSIKYLGTAFIWNINSKLNLNVPKVDIVFTRVDEFFSQFLSRKGFINIPGMVLFIFDLSKPLRKTWRLTKNKSLRDDLRIIRKYKYSYEITRDLDKFKYFYHSMYLPYIPKRFGRLTTITSFRNMRLTLDNGALLLVKQGNEYIAGNIIRLHNKIAYSSYFGIKEGKIKYLKQGAIAACYYFSILWTKKMGYRWLYFGHCRPYLNDGVFCYKRKWKMEIKKSNRKKDVFGMKIINFNQGVLNFLKNNPFVFMDRNKLKGFIFSDQKHPLTLEDVQYLFKTHYISGLNCLFIISPQGFIQQAKKFANSYPAQCLNLINTNPDIFFKKFPKNLK